jgi:hypothetical protein
VNRDRLPTTLVEYQSIIQEMLALLEILVYAHDEECYHTLLA